MTGDVRVGDKFESDVVLEGTQTSIKRHPAIKRFESDVVLEGTQKKNERDGTPGGFESE